MKKWADSILIVCACKLYLKFCNEIVQSQLKKMGDLIEKDVTAFAL
jgi:hypothetical protein